MAEAHAARPTRRLFLTGAIAGGAAVAGGAYGITRMVADDPAVTDRVVSRLVRDVPVDDPDSDVWGSAPKARIALDAQKVAVPMRPKPAFDTITVRSVHDGTTIAFLVEWKDEQADDLTVAVDGFRDACAVLLGKWPDEPTFRTMGTTERPATILHWKSDWQRDLDKGFQDLEAVFPRATFDFHPPLVDAARAVVGSQREPVVVADYEKAGATQWLPGLHVGNPLSIQGRTTPVEKLVAHGFGTLTPMATQDARGKGVHRDGGWHVVLAKSLAATDDEEVTLGAGSSHALAVAVWSGGDNDAGSRKSPCKASLTVALDPA